jgi:hypothetical protein
MRAPPVDIYEDEEGLVVLADLPGVAPEELDVRVEQRVLTISAHAGAAPSGTSLQSVYELTGFFRQFQLPEEVDAGRILYAPGILSPKFALPHAVGLPRRETMRSEGLYITQPKAIQPAAASSVTGWCNAMGGETYQSARV